MAVWSGHRKAEAVLADRPVIFAMGRMDAAGGIISQFNALNISLVSPGVYGVFFDVPHPQGADYVINISTASDEPNRDQRKIGYRNVTNLGFEIVTTIDDNGGVADGFANIGVSFTVMSVEQVVVDVD